eukprot:2145011-Pleurochrysis_carterae.AAC.3
MHKIRKSAEVVASQRLHGARATAAEPHKNHHRNKRMTRQKAARRQTGLGTDARLATDSATHFPSVSTTAVSCNSLWQVAGRSLCLRSALETASETLTNR